MENIKINLRNELLQEHSRHQALKIVDYICDNQAAFVDLIELFFTDEYRVTQRASWPLSLLAEKQPGLFDPYVERLILNLENRVHDAVKRNSTKILLLMEIPENFIGITVDIMFKILLDKKQPVAIKANAMSIIFRCCKNEPELMRELKIIIEDQLPYATPAFSSRAKKIMKYDVKLVP